MQKRRGTRIKPPIEPAPKRVGQEQQAAHKRAITLMEQEVANPEHVPGQSVAKTPLAKPRVRPESSRLLLRQSIANLRVAEGQKDRQGAEPFNRAFLGVNVDANKQERGSGHLGLPYFC